MAKTDDLNDGTFGLGDGSHTNTGWGTTYGSDAGAGFNASKSSGASAPITTQPVARTNGFDSSPATPAGGGNGLSTDVYAHDALARSVYSSLQGAGHDVKWNGNQLMVDGRPYDLAPYGNIDPRLAGVYAKYGSTDTGAGSGLTDFSYWNGKVTNGDANYFLGRLDDDLAGHGMDSPGAGGGSFAPSFASFGSMGAGVPGFEEPQAPWGAEGPAVYNPGTISFDDIPNFTRDQLLGEMRSGAAGAPLENLIGDIEAHPTSLDDHAVDTMKAQLKDTLAEQGQFEDEDLRGLGASMGIGDSPWLASQRAMQRRSTDQAIASGRANIDIEAAKTRQQEKLASAGVGQSFANARSQQVMDTVNAGLQRATVTGNRLALRESVAQAAAASRQSAQKIMADWIQQNLGLKLDYAKLQTQNSQFLEDLMFKGQQLAEQRAEFGANFQRASDNDAWEHQFAEDNI